MDDVSRNRVRHQRRDGKVKLASKLANVSRFSRINQKWGFIGAWWTVFYGTESRAISYRKKSKKIWEFVHLNQQAFIGEGASVFVALNRVEGASWIQCETPVRRGVYENPFFLHRIRISPPFHTAPSFIRQHFHLGRVVWGPAECLHSQGVGFNGIKTEYY